MLEETLQRWPERFHAHIMRPGQISGSRTSGVWRRHELLSFMVKSCRALQALPILDGELSWTPVEDVAGCCVDPMLRESARNPVYHIGNPVRQPWAPMIQL